MGELNAWVDGPEGAITGASFNQVCPARRRSASSAAGPRGQCFRGIGIQCFSHKLGNFISLSLMLYSCPVKKNA